VIAGSFDEFKPGVFQMFKPTAVEYITKGGETEEELEALVKRGITPVQVKQDDGTLFSGVAIEEQFDPTRDPLKDVEDGDDGQ
jgi:hypothetical protein